MPTDETEPEFPTGAPSEPTDGPTTASGHEESPSTSGVASGRSEAPGNDDTQGGELGPGQKPPAPGRDASPAPSRIPAHRTPAEVEAAFAKIVAGFDSAQNDTPWPAAENVGAPDERRDPPPIHNLQRWRSSSINPYEDQDDGTLLDALDTFGADLPDDDEDDRYIPPPPPPLPHFSTNAILGTLALVVGLLLILAPRLLPTTEQNARTLGFVSMVSGAGVLIWRLRPDRDDDDDGARV